MKKLLLIVALVALSMGAYAQTGFNSAVLKAGYASEPGRFGIGVQGRYSLTENIRVAPDAVFLFPKNSITGLNINVDFHYAFPVQGGLDIYPLAGLAMANNRLSFGGQSRGYTNFGLNLGAGADYALSANNFLNVEFRYTLSDGDFGFFSVGYGFKF